MLSVNGPNGAGSGVQHDKKEAASGANKLGAESQAAGGS